MTTYFGFLPSDQLRTKIEEIQHIIENNIKTDYYPHRDEVTKLIAHELIDNLLNDLVTLIQDPERKHRLEKVVKTVHGTVDTLLGSILSKQSNDKVIDSYHFMVNHSLFTDNDDQMRVGYELPHEDAQLINDNFDKIQTAITQAKRPHTHLQNASETIINATLHHYLHDFGQTLHLGLLKRGAIPIAETAISKSAQIAIHKIMPDMPQTATERLYHHYQQLIVQK